MNDDLDKSPKAAIKISVSVLAGLHGVCGGRLARNPKNLIILISRSLFRLLVDDSDLSETFLYLEHYELLDP